MRKQILLLFISIFLLSLCFAETSASQEQLVAKSDTSNMYSLCVNNYAGNNVTEECSNIISEARTISEILNFVYVDNVDDSEYLSCVKSKITEGSLNYVTIRDKCYETIMQKNKLKQLFSVFKVNCFYDVNSELNENGKYDLRVTCKSIIPSLCFNNSVDLIKDLNTNSYILQPIIKQDSDVCYDLARIKLYQKEFEIDKRDAFINIQPYVIKNGLDEQLPLESLFTHNSLISNIPKMQDVDRSYYSCLVNYYLHNNYDNSGLTMNNNKISDSEVIDLCKTKVTYAYSIYLDDIIKNKLLEKQKMQSALTDFLSQPDLSEMQTFFDGVLESYDKYRLIDTKLINSKGHLPLNLPLDILINRLNNVIEGKDQSFKKEKISEFKVTLINDIKDKIEVRRKSNLPQVIDFFNKEISGLESEDMKTIFKSLKLEVVLDLVETEKVLDFTDVNFVIGVGGVTISDLSFVPDKPIVVIGDENYIFNLNNDSVQFSTLSSDILINTNISMSLKNNQLYVNDKNILVLTDFSDSELPGIINEVNLVKDEDLFLVYVAEKHLKGYFLGLFKVDEQVIEKYNAQTGVLFDVEKPWWDFLIVYPKSIKEGVQNTIVDFNIDLNN